MTRRSYGTGSLVESKPGTWRLRVFVGTSPVTGKPMQISRTVHTKTRGGKAEAQREMAKFIAEVEQGHHKGRDATFGRLLAEWMTHLEHQGKAPSTLATYQTHVKNRIVPALGSLKLSALNAHALDQFYMEQKAGGLGIQTIKLLHSIISTALQQGVSWGWIDKNEARRAKPPADTRDGPGVLTPNEVQRLIDGADIDLAAAITLAALTGARRGELCGLKWSDIDWDAETLRIERSRVPVSGQGVITGKTKTKTARTIRLDPVCVERLRIYRAVVAGRGVPTTFYDDVASDLDDPEYAREFAAAAVDSGVSIGDVVDSRVFSPDGPRCAKCGEPMWTANNDAPASHVRDSHPEDHVPVAADPWLLTPDDGTTPYNPKQLSHHITQLGKKLGIDVHTHSLRHFSASYLVGSGVDVTTASARLGHTTAVMLETYSHPISERDGDAAAILGRLLTKKDDG